MSDLNKYPFTYSPATTYTNSTSPPWAGSSSVADQLKDVMRQFKEIEARRPKDIADTIVCTSIGLEKLKSGLSAAPIAAPIDDPYHMFGIPLHIYETFEQTVIEGLKLRAAGKKVLLVDNAGDVKDMGTGYRSLDDRT